MFERHMPSELQQFKVASRRQNKHSSKLRARWLHTLSNSHLPKMSQHDFVKKLVFRALQLLKIFALKHRKKQLASQRQHTPPSKQSVNKQSHHFAMKSVHLPLNSLQRLSEKHSMTRHVSHESLTVS
jgi:hypothetical protein